MIKNQRRPKNAVDTERIKIIRCKYCRQKITFGCSVGRDEKRLACNIGGTLRIDKEWGERKL